MKNSPARNAFILTHLSVATLLAACGGGSGQSDGAPMSVVAAADAASQDSAMSDALRYRRTTTTPVTAAPAPAPAVAATPAPAPTTIAVALQWATPANTRLSGSQALELTGRAFENVEIFSGGTRIATATVSSDSTSAKAVIDTTQFADGTVALTAHAWNSPAGTAFTSEADAGLLKVVVSNTVAAAPAPAAAAPAAVTPTSSDLSITAFGAVCNGSTNNSTAITNAIAAAKAKGVSVVIPSGVCAYGDVINLDGVKLIGYGDASVLYALNTNREAIFMRGSGAEVRSVKLSGIKASTRVAPWEATRITLFGATKFVIDNVTIDGGSAAGIQTAQATNNGTISNNRVIGTLADSIHMTDRASYITVTGNRVENSGDDGIAVVSYKSDGGMVNHITARNNVIVNNKWGRQMSVVGGSDVLYENNDMENNIAGYACLYLAQENPYATYGAHNVVAQRNTMKNCGGASTGHGAVMVYSDGGEANTNITLTRNDITQNGQAGVRVFSSMNTGVTLDSNRIQGASPALDVTSPGVSITAYASGAVGYIAP